MTPEPSAGYYHENGVAAFVRKYGYADRNSVPDRLNFGGIHKVGLRHDTTRLTLSISGFDMTAGKIVDPAGAVELVSETGEVAAAWAFSKLFEHWSRKHAKAAYVPSQCRKDPARQYCYGDRVRLAEGTDSLRLLKALGAGSIYYDPGIKLEHASSAKPKHKSRSQFRIASRSIAALYERVAVVTL